MQRGLLEEAFVVRYFLSALPLNGGVGRTLDFEE